jgi:hypothetical protein
MGACVPELVLGCGWFSNPTCDENHSCPPPAGMCVVASNQDKPHYLNYGPCRDETALVDASAPDVGDDDQSVESVIPGEESSTPDASLEDSGPEADAAPDASVEDAKAADRAADSLGERDAGGERAIDADAESRRDGDLEAGADAESGSGVAPPMVWYPFDESSGDLAGDVSGGGRNASLVNSPLWISGHIGNAIQLNGTNQYATLPSDIVPKLNDFTIAAWVRLRANPIWSRIFDFGNDNDVNMFLTSHGGGNGAIRYAITTQGYNAEQRINGIEALPTGAWKHVAVTVTGTVGILYVDGAEVGRNPDLTLTPSALGTTSLNYIGRSQYRSDPYLDGEVDDLRIYDRGLDPAEVLALSTGGADQ